MAAEAVWAPMAPPSPTSLLPTPSLATSCLKPVAFLAPWRQTVSLLCIPVLPGSADAACLKRSRGKARTSAHVRSPVIYNCRTRAYPPVSLSCSTTQQHKAVIPSSTSSRHVEGGAAGTATIIWASCCCFNTLIAANIVAPVALTTVVSYVYVT